MSQRERATFSPPVYFGPKEWTEEVERFALNSPARLQAQRARREIRAGRAPLALRRCRAEGAPDGTSLRGCVKLYVPLGKPGASEAPYGFVFRLQQESEGGLSLNLVAFGERHPDNPATRTVYERAHKRLHGHYP
ncbi:MAG: hypothetical protein ACTHLH_11585 [Solirubrobacterales bacterium]